MGDLCKNMASGTHNFVLQSYWEKNYLLGSLVFLTYLGKVLSLSRYKCCSKQADGMQAFQQDEGSESLSTGH